MGGDFVNILNVAYYTIKRNIRDKRSLCLMLLFPIVLILILGTALGGQFKPQNVDKTVVYYINNDNGEMGKAFDQFINRDEIKEVLDVKTIDSKEEARKIVTGGGAVALIEVDEDFTANYALGEKAKVHVYKNNNSGFRASVVRNIVDSFIDGANSGKAILRIGKMPDYKTFTTIEDTPLKTDGKIPGAMDYYAVTMLVMILMYGAGYGTYGMAEDYLYDMGNRIKASPIKIHELFIGKILGTILTIFCQGLLIILFTKFVYKANWGSSIVQIAFICLSLSVFSTAMGSAACILFKNEKTADSITSILTPIFTFLAGGYVPINSSNNVFASIRMLSPNFLAQTAIFNTIYGGEVLDIYISTGILWAASLIMLLVSLAAARRVKA